MTAFLGATDFASKDVIDSTGIRLVVITIAMG
jgi:hypothetical protein